MALKRVDFYRNAAGTFGFRRAYRDFEVSPERDGIKLESMDWDVLFKGTSIEIYCKSLTRGADNPDLCRRFHKDLEEGSLFLFTTHDDWYWMWRDKATQDILDVYEIDQIKSVTPGKKIHLQQVNLVTIGYEGEETIEAEEVIEAEETIEAEGAIYHAGDAYGAMSATDERKEYDDSDLGHMNTADEGSEFDHSNQGYVSAEGKSEGGFTIKLERGKGRESRSFKMILSKDSRVLSIVPKMMIHHASHKPNQYVVVSDAVLEVNGFVLVKNRNTHRTLYVAKDTTLEEVHRELQEMIKLDKLRKMSEVAEIHWLDELTEMGEVSEFSGLSKGSRWKMVNQIIKGELVYDSLYPVITEGFLRKFGVTKQDIIQSME